MTHWWILNASPIICLASAGYLELIDKLAEKLCIPGAVADEILCGPKEDHARQILSANRYPFLQVEPLPEVLAWDLGQGETAVLSYALNNPGWTAIIDDRAARKCANSFAIPCLGTIAIIIRARQQGIIASASEGIRALKDSGIWLDDNVIRAALKQLVDENW